MIGISETENKDGGVTPIDLNSTYHPLCLGDDVGLACHGGGDDMVVVGIVWHRAVTKGLYPADWAGGGGMTLNIAAEAWLEK